MPIHEDMQDSGPETKDMPLSGSAAEKVMLPPVLAVSLRYIAVNQKYEWQYNLHDLTGWHTCPHQDYYYPPIRVTRVLLNDSSNTVRYISVDLAGNAWTANQVDKTQQQLGITLSLLTNTEHMVHVTKLYFNTLSVVYTNADSIVLLG
jgi:hypothetical protein